MSDISTYTLKGSSTQGLVGATIGFFVGFAAVALFGPTAAKFKEVLQLSPVLIGLLVAMPSLSGSLLRIPFAAWVDITGGRKPLLVLLGLSILGMFGLFLVVYLLYPDRLNGDLYPVLLFLGLLCGCGIATFSVGISQVSYWHPQAQQGRALGIYAGVGNLAPGLFSFLLPIALSSWGLTGSYLAWLIFLVVGTVLYYVVGVNARCFQLMAQGFPLGEAKRISRQYGQELFPTGGFTHSLKTSARVWKTWALVFVYFTSFGGFLALTAWLPTYWQSFFGVSAVAAGGLTALYSVLASLVRVGGGFVADKFGGENTGLLALLVMVLGAILMTISSVYGLAVAAEVLMAVGMGVANAAVFKLVPRPVPEAVGGTAGWVGGLGAFGGFVIPPLMATFVSVQGQAGYSSGFVVFIVLALPSLAAIFWLKRTDVAVVTGPAAAAQSEAALSPKSVK
ncbi:MAG: MFS transporter [Chloroflexi bacterium]|nr:MFS transporter [Chloroflexota bacterium]